ncbi:MAG: malate dehydrogenase [Aigarchaeota archaeon]|nr:malate dehydrogenase [Aigarchaeota archaeon]MCX8192235.1 malate dehydrogenase [Nitrososphaeria archaeon]MDW7986157.1 malate dehydrogenase [Nitrososphaerota archaeon]
MITIVGSGRVGIAAAIHIALKELDDLTLIDIVEGLPQGEALDLQHMCGILDIDIDIRGSNDYKDMEGSDIVIVPAGFIRKADMTRMDLLFKNFDVVKQVSEKIKEYAPKSKVVVVTNPLDPMTYTVYKVTGFERNRVMGFSGPLDTGRFKSLIRRELKVSYKSIDAPITGEHGETMVLLPRLTYICGKPLIELLPREKINQLVEETRKMGAQIIKLKGWSASHSTGAGIAIMVESIVKDKKRVIPTSIYLQGEYGLSDVCLVTPAVIGKDGIEKIIELPLNDEERSALLKSYETVKNAIAQLKF